MKVNQTGAGTVQANEASGAKSADRISQSHGSRRSNKSAEIDTKGTKTEISPRAREFAQAKDVASKAPDVREDRVEELKQRIAEGKYNIDSKSIAERMVDEHMKTAR